MSDKPQEWQDAKTGVVYVMVPKDEWESLTAEVKWRREQISQAFDAMDSRQSPKKFTRYPCHCGAMISNSGVAAHSHLRGSLHRQNLERKALGLDPV